MSLRARLLLAIGVVALIALVAADLATYSSLRSFLYDRVDQSLETTYATITQPQPGHRGFDEGTGATVTAETYVAQREPDGTERIVKPYYRRGRESGPKLPAVIPGLTSG